MKPDLISGTTQEQEESDQSLNYLTWKVTSNSSKELSTENRILFKIYITPPNK